MVLDAPALVVRGLAKRFGEIQAVAGVDFEVRTGEIFGFLGPNGAGKTTTINMLTGLARPDAGSMWIGGIDCSRDPKAAQHLMGIVPDESNLYPELTGFENLAFCGALYGLRRREREARARELLATFGLREAGDRRFAGYSKGMKRRLTIAAGVIHDPPILFLDEATSGIDVASARRIRQFIADLNDGGTTVFLTTHHIEEAERLCHRIAFIVRGRIERTDAVQDLLRQADGRHVVRFAVVTAANAGAANGTSGEPGANGVDALCAALTDAFPDLSCQMVAPDALSVSAPRPLRVGPLVRFLEERGAEVTEARIVRPSLEEVFVAITCIEAKELRHEPEARRKGGRA